MRQIFKFQTLAPGWIAISHLYEFKTRTRNFGASKQFQIASNKHMTANNDLVVSRAVTVIMISWRRQ